MSTSENTVRCDNCCGDFPQESIFKIRVLENILDKNGNKEMTAVYRYFCSRECEKGYFSKLRTKEK